MKGVRLAVLVLVGSLMLSANAMAGRHSDRDQSFDKGRDRSHHNKLFREHKHTRHCDHNNEQPGPSPKQVPEIDVAGGAMAAALLMGLLGLVRERKRKL